MELDQLKADWQQQHSLENTGGSKNTNKLEMDNTDIRDMDNIVTRMSALEKEIRNRTLYGVLSFAIIVASVLAFAYFLYVLNMPLIAIGGLLTWVFFIAIATVVLVVLQRQIARHDNTLSIESSLVKKRQRVKSERRFYQTVVWWLLAPMSIGIIMILIATQASLMAASFEFVVFVLCMYWGHQYNRRYIASNLKPLEDVLEKSIHSIKFS